jgi:hypothetical protein
MSALGALSWLLVSELVLVFCCCPAIASWEIAELVGGMGDT